MQALRSCHYIPFDLAGAERRRDGGLRAEIVTAVRAMEGGTGGVKAIELSPEYLAAGVSNSERRLVQAGFRLGTVLRAFIAK